MASREQETWKVAHSGFDRGPCVVSRRDGKPITVAECNTEEDAAFIVAAQKTAADCDRLRDISGELAAVLSELYRRMFWSMNGRERDAIRKRIVPTIKRAEGSLPAEGVSVLHKRCQNLARRNDEMFAALQVLVAAHNCGAPDTDPVHRRLWKGVQAVVAEELKERES